MGLRSRAGRAAEAVAGVREGSREQLWGGPLQPPEGPPPDSVGTAARTTNLLLLPASWSSVTSVEKFPLLLSRLSCRLSKVCLPEQQNNVTLSSPLSSFQRLRIVTGTHVDSVFLT